MQVVTTCQGGKLKVWGGAVDKEISTAILAWTRESIAGCESCLQLRIK
jgi:hypothetical protein